MCVTAAPSSELSRIRRRLLPTVVPKPRSKGSAVNFAYVSVETCSSRVTREGSSRPRQRILMMVAPCDQLNCGKFPSSTLRTICTPTSSVNTNKFAIFDLQFAIVNEPNCDKSQIGNRKSQMLLHSSLLWWTTPVMWKRCDVLNSADLQSRVLKIQNRLFSS